MFLTNLSLKRPVFAIVVIIAMLAIGITSFLNLNLNDMPETNMPYVTVSISLPGASPDQVESKVTKKVEEAIGQLSGVNHITSSISEGYSMTMVEFDDTRDADAAAQDVRTKMNAIRGDLPDDTGEPTISKMDINGDPILSLSVTGKMNEAELSDLVDNTIIPEINRVSGVGSVTSYGLLEREVQVKLDKDKLAALNITIDQVTGALGSDNLDTPSGKVGNKSREVTIRTNSSIKDVNDFKNITVATIDGTEVRIGDIAEVVDGYKSKDSISHFNGKECIGIDIVKQSGTNTVKVAEAVKSKIAALEKSLPNEVKISVVTDNSTSIQASVTGVEETMIEGCILAVLIIFLFLRTLGSTMVSAISLPTSIITTFAAMKIMGFTLNTMSLMALSLSVGLLVDDAIVVIENIERHLRLGRSPLEAAKEATSEIGLAVLATTMTIVAVFLPMSVGRGIIGKIFKEFGLTIAFAVLISLFVSFTLVPLMASRFVRDVGDQKPKTKFQRFLAWFNYQFDRLAIIYDKILGFVLKHRKKTLLAAAGMFVMSLTLIPMMGMNFMSQEDRGTVTINAELDSGLSLFAAEEKAKQIEQAIKKYPEVKTVYTTVKKDSISMILGLTDKKDRKKSGDELAAEIRSEIKKYPGLDLSVAGTSDPGMSDSRKLYSLHIQGNNFEQLLEYSQKAKQLLAEIPGATDVGISYKAGKPETQILVDRDAAADLGVVPASISSTLTTLFNGTTVGQYEDNGDRIDITVSVEDSQSTGVDSINGIYIASSTTGQMIPVEMLTKKQYTTASSQIERYDKSRDIQVEANNEIGYSSSDISAEFEKRLMEELSPPKGIYFVKGGDDQMVEESTATMTQAVVLGILFIFLILAAQFESWIDPLAIMFSLPLAIIGAMFALFITGAGFSMIGMIGIIFLLGLVTKNAILLVDFIKKKRQEGMERTKAIMEAGLTRLRPIMMTTLAMILGMLPSALDSGIGSETRQPMAIAIIGGLISSTLLTLLVVPVIYTYLDDWKAKLKPGKLFKKIKNLINILPIK
ncbi:efflux RND transporter permease subunit [Clostridium aminobutyricum]|uniref:Efflux RND transporter permease subunit n=1 Tax=Clostridium aminobutyricum TaxID=33953 RepID=A0A939IHB8_CLOAM|nr:efflux RND transporter permease subunit [Clostridium aminobutyricum]MBN7773547.1 efflux RND transporter permease subunit [Clostridium aminobutyricum]